MTATGAAADGREAVIAGVREVPGWLTDAQAGRLWDAAAAVRDGAIVEIGSFRGRSTIVLANAASPRDGRVTAIDPHLGGDRGPQEIAETPALGADDHAAFEHNLTAAGVRDRVVHVRERSQQALGAVREPIALLYVDGAHRVVPAGQDLRHWGARVRPGGTLLVHDAFSSIGVTVALFAVVIGRDGWRFAGRDGSLAEYRRGPALSRAQRAAELATAVAQLPWFARNLMLKALLLAGRPGLARALGHRTGTWPY
jgi:hypothetical protein